MAKASRACTVFLRLSAMASVISAAAIMATSHQTTTVFNITLKAEFYQTPSFLFFLVANAVAGVYSFVTLFVPPAGFLSRWVVVSDVIISMVLAAAIAAVGAIAQVGKKGNERAGWLPICDEVPKYCNHVMGAMIGGFIGLLLYTILVIHTISSELNPLLP